MNPFSYVRPADGASALEQAARGHGTAFLGGGTSLLDLMKEGVERPNALIDLTRVPELGGIRETSAGGLQIGASVTNTAIARHPAVRDRYALLSKAILAGASPQIRNMATAGGNLMQRTRCGYFRDVAIPECNKRAPGSGCAAIDGENRGHALLGGSPDCIAVHASDMAVALVALDAVVALRGSHATRRIPVEEFHLVPGDTPNIETVLKDDELIEAVELPPRKEGRRIDHYLKVRDRASYAFALVSVAASVQLDDRGTVRDARLALGGVATKPWRCRDAEALLIGRALTEDSVTATAVSALAGAEARPKNVGRLELAKRAVRRTLAYVGSQA